MIWRFTYRNAGESQQADRHLEKSNETSPRPRLSAINLLKSPPFWQ
jgi:hypothetical protein